MLMRTFRQVIDRWPSRAELARDLGVPAQNVRKWYFRDNIPGNVWWRLAQRAIMRNIPITISELAYIANRWGGYDVRKDSEDEPVR